MAEDANEQPMWEHFCEEEQCIIGVAKGEPCNWCEKREEENG